MIKVALITSTVAAPEKDLAALEFAHGVDVELTEYRVADGPAEIESDLDCLKAGPGIVQCATGAQRAGANAIVIGCMADPALFAVREVVNIPVVGAGESAIHWSYALGGKIGWIDVAKNARWIVQRQFDLCGASTRFSAFSTITIPPTALSNSRNEVFEKLCKKSVEMCEDAGVNTIILGCTLLTDMKQELENWLQRKTSPESGRVEIIAGLPLAVSSAVVLARQGLRHF